MSPRHGEPQRGKALLQSAFIYFAIVFGVGFLLGAVRVPFLVPRLGQRVAELLEMPLMAAAIYWAAGWVVKRFGSSMQARGWALCGLLALALLLGAEWLLAVALTGRGVAEYIASRDPVSGSVYLILLLVFAAMPRLRQGRTIHTLSA